MDDLIKIPVRRAFALLPLILFLATGSMAHDRNWKVECEKTRQKIAKIRSKMRQGYHVSQGIKMEDQLRRLRKLRSKYCHPG